MNLEDFKVQTISILSIVMADKLRVILTRKESHYKIQLIVIQIFNMIRQIWQLLSPSTNVAAEYIWPDPSHYTLVCEGTKDWIIKETTTFTHFPIHEIRSIINRRQQLSFELTLSALETEALHDSVGPSSIGRPNILRFRSIDPTAIYFESGPNFTQVTFPVPDKSGKVLIQFHSDFTFATW